MKSLSFGELEPREASIAFAKHAACGRIALMDRDEDRTNALDFVEHLATIAQERKNAIVTARIIDADNLLHATIAESNVEESADFTFPYVRGREVPIIPFFEDITSDASVAVARDARLELEGIYCAGLILGVEGGTLAWSCAYEEPIVSDHEAL